MGWLLGVEDGPDVCGVKEGALLDGVSLGSEDGEVVGLDVIGLIEGTLTDGYIVGFVVGADGEIVGDIVG